VRSPRDAAAGHDAFNRRTGRMHRVILVVLICVMLQVRPLGSSGIRITASRRASATIAFFIPRRLAICIAQTLSQTGE
jgi:hypothetical protein